MGPILAGYLVAVVVKFRKRLDDPLVGWALLTMFVVCAFFFSLLAGPANPFERGARRSATTAPAPTRCCRTTC